MRYVVPIVLAIIAATPSLAQTRRPPADAVAEPKSPELARQYAYYFTGAGHFYTGETTRAAVMGGISIISAWKLIDSLGCSYASDLIATDMGCSRAIAFLSLAGLLAPYVYGIIDAPKSAARVNARRRLSPHAAISHDGRGAIRAELGLLIAFGTK